MDDHSEKTRDQFQEAPERKDPDGQDGQGHADILMAKESNGFVRSSREIVEQTNELARRFYRMMGYVVKDGYCFHEATHPQEVLCWKMAAEAMEFLTSTELSDALYDLEETGD